MGGESSYTVERRVRRNEEDRLVAATPDELKPRSTQSLANAVEQPVQAPNIKGPVLKTLEALADQRKVWTVDGLADELNTTPTSVRMNVNRLRRLGFLAENQYRLTSEGRMTEGAALPKEQAVIVSALRQGTLPYRGLIFAANEPNERTLRDTIARLQEREMIVKVPIQASKAGLEYLRSIGKSGEVYNDRAAVLLRIAAGDTTKKTIEAAIGHRAEDILDGLERSRFITRNEAESPAARMGGADLTITREGRQFLSRYLAAFDEPEITVGTTKLAAQQGEIKVRLLHGIREAGSNADMRYVYAELPFPYDSVQKAFSDAFTQGLIGQNLVVADPDARIGGKTTSVSVQARHILKKLQRSDQGMTIDKIAKEFKLEHEKAQRYVDYLVEKQAVAVQKIFVTKQGQALLDSSAEMLSKPLLRAVKVRNIPNQEEQRRLSEIAAPFGTPTMKEMNQFEAATVRRAKAILLALDNKKTSEIAKAMNVTTTSVSNWLKMFNENGMKIFDERPEHEPRAPKVKVRELNVGEIDELQGLSGNFDASRRHSMPFHLYIKQRNARIIILSRDGATPNATIAEETNTNIKMVFKAINTFNEIGMKMFDDSYGLAKPKKPIILTKEQEREVDQLASRFDISMTPELGRGDLEFTRIRHAKIVQMNAASKPMEVIAKEVGMSEHGVALTISRFKREGMALFDNLPKSKPTSFVRKLEPEEGDVLRRINKWWSPNNEKGLSTPAYAAASYAKAILESSAGRGATEISERTGISSPVVLRAISDFNKRGIRIFDSESINDPQKLSLATAHRTKFLTVRELTPEESSQLSAFADRYDPEMKARYSYNQLVEFRRAKTVQLSSQKIHPEEIGRQVDMTTVSVYRVINKFNANGMQMFSDLAKLSQEENPTHIEFRTGGQTPNLFARKLTRGERTLLDRMASLLENDGLPEFAVWGAKKARAIVMSSDGIDARKVAHKTEITYVSLRNLIKSFNEHGMDIFTTPELKTVVH